MLCTVLRFALHYFSLHITFRFAFRFLSLAFRFALRYEISLLCLLSTCICLLFHPHNHPTTSNRTQWKAAGGSITSAITNENPDSTNKEPYIATLNKSLVVSLAEVAEIRDTGIAQICDARSAGRFVGTAPEPRAGRYYMLLSQQRICKSFK
jgi:hypothetical protein